MKKRIAKTLSLFNLYDTFPTKKSARDYFESILWKNKVVCSKCKSEKKIKKQKDDFNYWCGECRNYFNVFTNTPLERNKIDPRKWIFACYLMMTSRKGVSSLQLSKELSIKQSTAWYMLHRLRLACNTKSELLNGIVEVDETYIGGLEKNKHKEKKIKNNQGRSTKSKVAVVELKERGGKVRAKVFNKVNSYELQNYINRNVKKGSVLSTDEALFYNPIRNYKKIKVNHSAKEYVNGMASTNGIESVWAVLKRGYNGVYHNFSKKHLQKYVNEFTFRLNEGNCQIDTIDRMNNLFSNMFGKKITYKGLIK